MKKQAYKVTSLNWMITIKKGNSVIYRYGANKRHLLNSVKNKKGIVQLFKVSHEFRDAKIQE